MRTSTRSGIISTFALATLLSAQAQATLHTTDIVGWIDVQEDGPDLPETAGRYEQETDFRICDKYNTLSTFIIRQTLSDGTPQNMAAMITEVFKVLPKTIKNKLDKRDIAPAALVKYVNDETKILIKNLVAASPVSLASFDIPTIEVELETMPGACPFTEIVPERIIHQPGPTR